MKCFIGLVKNKKVREYCLGESNNGKYCILDIWDLAYNKYKDIEPGDKAFIYDKANDDLYYGFEAESKPNKLSQSPFRFGQTKLDLRIDLKLSEGFDKPKVKIRDGRKLLEKVGVTFSGENPEPRVYSDEVCKKIDEFFKKIKSKEDQIKESYEERTDRKLDDKEIKMLLAAENNYPLQESDTTFDDVKGLNNIKQLVENLIKAAEDKEKCKAYKLQISRGIFLFGPPGTGKTIFAKAVAAKIDAKYFEISPSIIAGFPGEAETIIEIFLRERFEQFKKAGKGVIIFDEADALFPDRNKPYMSSVMARIVPTFLRVIDNLLKEEEYRYCPIFLFAISNHPEAIDDAFLRPGRFSDLYYVALPGDKENNEDKEYKELFEYYLKNRNSAVEDSLFNNLAELVKKLKERTKKIREEIQEKGNSELHDDFGKFSPADINEIINQAALESCLEDKKISFSKIESVIDKAIPSVINEILVKNEEFKKNHPNAKVA